MADSHSNTAAVQATNDNASLINCAHTTDSVLVVSQDLPYDLIVEVGDISFSLHKFMLASKSNYIRQLIMECDPNELTRIDLFDIPGGPKIFEKAIKLCYIVNFEITIYNVVSLCCAAEYLKMTDKYCPNNLVGPFADDLNLFKRCVEAVSSKACSKANFPSQSPPNCFPNQLPLLCSPMCNYSPSIDMLHKRAREVDLHDSRACEGQRSSGPVIHMRRQKAVRSRQHKEGYLEIRGEGEERGGFQRRQFNGIDVLIPKYARKVDDDLYRAIDLYLKAYPNLDEIEREKNKRMPVQIVLHALYYDQLKLRRLWHDDDSGADLCITDEGERGAKIGVAEDEDVLIGDSAQGSSNDVVGHRRPRGRRFSIS
ncbi:hypothetical protein K1719_010827 [Acacia pycnantha]|nr:hypothetical protein K1719_010827 [Acacia pycnantha]